MDRKKLGEQVATVVGAGSLLLAFSSGGASTGQCTAPVMETGDGGLRSFTPPDLTKLRQGQLLLTASGEALAQTGYAFPDMPSNGVFADGWAVHFNHFIALFDKVTVSNNPDMVPTDQSQMGELVAEADGPWAIDL